jgi:peroxiredoxin Q/BCP
MILQVNDPAPAFALYDEQHQLRNLRDYLGKYVVLYFYPQDDTPGCTQEACDFRDRSPEFSGLNAVIVGVSHDSEDSHTRFAQKYGLPFVLLADPEAKVLQEYGVWQERTLRGKTSSGTVRTTFLIDPRGKIAGIYQNVAVRDHVAEVLNDLKHTQALRTP